MPPSKSQDDATAGTAQQSGALAQANGRAGPRLPMPVPLLLQLCRPLNTMDDVESLAAQLNCARARGCF
jgi:hypothetical protein